MKFRGFPYTVKTIINYFCLIEVFIMNNNYVIMVFIVPHYILDCHVNSQCSTRSITIRREVVEQIEGGTLQKNFKERTKAFLE